MDICTRSRMLRLGVCRCPTGPLGGKAGQLTLGYTLGSLGGSSEGSWTKTCCQLVFRTPFSSSFWSSAQGAKTLLECLVPFKVKQGRSLSKRTRCVWALRNYPETVLIHSEWPLNFWQWFFSGLWEPTTCDERCVFRRTSGHWYDKQYYLEDF